MPAGRRERKKAETRQLLADVAADLFAEHGFDGVSIADVARRADVSDQTVYNYFPAKHDLALDRAEAIRERLHGLVVGRPAGSSPADALRVVADEDIERQRRADLRAARGQFFALCISSPVVRRFGLEVRDQQVDTLRSAIVGTTSGLDEALAHVHAAGLVAVLQFVGDRIGRSTVRGEFSDAEADELTRDAHRAFDSLAAHFALLTAG